MSTETQVKLKFLGVDFPYINFDSEIQFSGDEQVEIKIEPRVFFPKENINEFKIIQDVNVFVKEVFSLRIMAIGSFELNDVEDESLRHTFVNMNAPAIMFPYIRSFISTLTSNIGNVTGTLNIPPQFFKGKLPVLTDEQFNKNIKEDESH